MPMKSIDVKIANNNFNITTFGFIQGFGLKKKLIKLVSPFAYLLTRGDSNKGMLDQEVTDDGLHKFVEKVCSKLDYDILGLIVELCSTTLVNNKAMTKDQIDILFAGDYESMYKLIVEIIKVNNFLPQGTIGTIQSNLRKKIVPQVTG